MGTSLFLPTSSGSLVTNGACSYDPARRETTFSNIADIQSCYYSAYKREVEVHHIQYTLYPRQIMRVCLQAFVPHSPDHVN